MIYADYLSTAEMQRWNLDTDIAWDEIDPQLALGQPEILARVRDSALIESFFPIFTCRAMDRLWDDIASTKLFITGGVGARFDGEAFGEPYELPADQCYCETCAAIGSLMWNWRLLLSSGQTWSSS